MQTVRLADTSGKIKDDYPTELTDYLDLSDFISRIHSLNIPYESYQRKRGPRIVFVLGIMVFGGIIDFIVMTRTDGWERFAVLGISVAVVFAAIIWLINYIWRAKDEVANERERLINGFNSEDNSRDINWLFVKASRAMCIRQPDHLVIELGRPSSSRSLPLAHKILIEKGGVEQYSPPYSPPAVHEIPGKTRDVIGIVNLSVKDYKILQEHNV